MVGGGCIRCDGGWRGPRVGVRRRNGLRERMGGGGGRRVGVGRRNGLRERMGGGGGEK